jgi:hypothetical protein
VFIAVYFGHKDINLSKVTFSGGLSVRALAIALAKCFAERVIFLINRFLLLSRKNRILQKRVNVVLVLAGRGPTPGANPEI